MVDPPPRNQDAAGAAHTFWRASGGETKGWGNDPLNSWRPYFKQVQEPSVAALLAISTGLAILILAVVWFVFFRT